MNLSSAYLMPVSSDDVRAGRMITRVFRTRLRYRAKMTDIKRHWAEWALYNATVFFLIEGTTSLYIADRSKFASIVLEWLLFAVFMNIARPYISLLVTWVWLRRYEDWRTRAISEQRVFAIGEQEL